MHNFGVRINKRISRSGRKADPVRRKALRADGKLVDSDRVETVLILSDLPALRVRRLSRLQGKTQRYD